MAANVRRSLFNTDDLQLTLPNNLNQKHFTIQNWGFKHKCKGNSYTYILNEEESSKRVCHVSLPCSIGRITRADLRQALEVPRYNLRGPQSSWSSRREPHTPRPRLSPAQVRELLILLDPEHTGVITQPSLELLKPRRVHSSPGRETLHTPTGGRKEEVMEDVAQVQEVQCVCLCVDVLAHVHVCVC